MEGGAVVVGVVVTEGAEGAEVVLSRAMEVVGLRVVSEVG